MKRFVVNFTLKNEQLVVLFITLLAANGLLLIALTFSASGLPTLQQQLHTARSQAHTINDLGGEIRRLRQEQKQGRDGVRLDADQTLRLLTDSGAQHGISLSKMQQSSGNRISVSVEDIAYTDLIAWLLTLRQQYSLGVQRISLEATVISGTVSARLSFETSKLPKPRGIQIKA